jgi:hypothetical protein
MFIKTTIQDFLNEGVNDNLLYTWISKYKIINLIENDIMFGEFKHVINGKDFYGNSFSRNKKLIIPHYYIRITVDKNLLSKNYRILPLDAEIIHRKINIDDESKYTKFRDRNPKKTNFFGDQPINKDFDKHRFDEEFVIGDIGNMSRYIKEIEIVKPNWIAEIIDDDLLEKLKEYCQNNKIVFIQV